MKKALALLAVVLCLATILTSCADPLVGTWTTTIDGQPGQMILKKDGTGQVVSSGISRPCTWEIKEERLTVVQEVSGTSYVFLDAVTYTIDEGTLTVVSYDGSKTLVFEKE